MSRAFLQSALGGIVLSCVGCAVLPQPAPPPMLMSAPTCRSTTTTLKVNGKDVPGYGQECLQPDGRWLPMGAPTTTPPAQPLPNLLMPSPVYVYPPPYYVAPDPYLEVFPWYFGPGAVIIGGHEGGDFRRGDGRRGGGYRR